MKKILFLLLIVSFFITNAPNGWGQSSKLVLKSPLLNWLKLNVSPITHLPYSFYIAPKDKPAVYRHMEDSGALQGTIERMITHEGLDIYDGAVYQIALSQTGLSQDLKQASLLDKYYWQGYLGDFWNIRAGYPISSFVYDPKDPSLVSSDMDNYGHRGFLFRIINADGKYLMTDPMDGKKSLRGFPDEDRLHWADWKPVAGENAWVVIAAMQIYHQKYYDKTKKVYAAHPESIELKLSRELARAAIILQSEIGGIRMAPLGAYRELNYQESHYFTSTNWWYNHISTENNISWYAAFRMLYQVTKEPQYKKAMEAIERYLKYVWNEKEGYLYQGAYCVNGRWIKASMYFALDVQTWSIACVGPRHLDELLGKDSAWRIWQAGRAHAGVLDQNNNILGVGYTDEHDRISVEWSAGAMTALAALADYYKDTDGKRWAQAMADKCSMRTSMDSLYYHISPNLAAYSYSSRRGAIPFGWNSHDPEVMSMASSGWMIFVDAGFNPFWLV
ncbi:MAG: hypothetical protein HQL13_05090 [Candidatus Omnitrophica bacterium]|nr:hypothetical protein [Candidatus Omnitrophota bacterium]